MTDIMDRLAKLGAVKGNPALRPKQPAKKTAYLDALRKTFPNGFVVENDYGLVFNNQLHMRLDVPHGMIDLRGSLEPNNRYCQITGFNDLKKSQLLAMDIETSGLSAEASAFVFMIGMGYFSDEEYIVDQLILADLSAEKAFLRQIELTYAKFKSLLTYNGRSFDQPMILNRARFHRLSLRGFDIPNLDLLHVVRRFWKQDLPNCRLATVEKEILKLTRGEEEVPGFMAPELYRAFLDSGDAESLRGVAYHNQIDVVSLSAFLLHLNRVARDPDPESADAKRFQRMEKAIDFRRMLSNPDPADVKAFCTSDTFTIINRRRIAEQLRIKGHFVEATRVLESLYEEGDCFAAEKLSLIYEQDLKDFDRALHWLEKSLDLLDADATIGIWSRKGKLERLQKRLRSINRKKGRENEQ